MYPCHEIVTERLLARAITGDNDAIVTLSRSKVNEGRRRTRKKGDRGRGDRTPQLNHERDLWVKPY